MREPRPLIRQLGAVGLLTALAAVCAGAGESGQPGLHAEYFGSPRFERPQGQETVPMPVLDGVDKGNDWSARFIGTLTAPQAGAYAFRVEADTGVRLKLDGQSVIDGWASDGVRTGKATLAKSQAIVVEYFFDRGQSGKTAGLRLLWTPPRGQEERIPASAFSHAVSTNPSVTMTSPSASDSSAPIFVHGVTQLAGGDAQPVVGVHNVQIFRACRSKPEVADGDGWTYAHHQDLACWKGRLYAAWAMTPVDEDVPPYKVVYATSTDGVHWSAPADLFPREVAWACRFYFYRARNGRMLAFCAGKSADGTVSEAVKSVLLVREIAADHRLGPVFTLIKPLPGLPASFETAQDAGFVAACREAAANGPLLEQQDYGRFLGDRRMKWHDLTPKFGGFYPFGKAFCFYHRKDGMLIGLCKMGFVIVSEDEGKTWSAPVNPPTLIAGAAKVWGQRTADGRFALAYNPDRAVRYPLVLVHGDDGREFRDMRVVDGEVPPLRYAGKYKDLGAQYMRGLAEWADDGTFPDRQAMWLVYSVNKEDIWIARIPLPVKPDEATFPRDEFADVALGGLVPGWNVYSPRWAPVAVVADGDARCLELRDGDPADHARAQRVFPAAARARIDLRLKAHQTNALLEIEVCDAAGRRPVRLGLTAKGNIQATDGTVLRRLGTYGAGTRLALAVTTDLAAGSYTVQVNDGPVQRLTVAEQGCASVERLSLRTGPWRGIGEAGGAVNPADDVPRADPAVFRVDRVNIAPLATPGAKRAAGERPRE